MSIFDLVLTGFDEIGLKMLNNNDLIDDIVNFDHLRSLLACFCLFHGPVIHIKIS